MSVKHTKNQANYKFSKLSRTSETTHTSFPPKVWRRHHRRR